MSDRLEEREENVRPEPEPDPEIPQLRTAEAEELAAEEAPEPEAQQEPEPEHAPGWFEVPAGYKVMTGSADGAGRAVGVVVAKFNGDITSRLLERALDDWAPDERSDRHAVSEGYASVTPLQPDLTDHAALGIVEAMTGQLATTKGR